LADAVNTRKIAVNPDVLSEEPMDFVSMLTEELAQIRAKYADDDTKKLQIAPKDEMKEQLGRSPDFADALMMRMYLDLNTSGREDVEGVSRINFIRKNKTKKYLFF
jgi:hypothetical protein